MSERYWKRNTLSICTFNVLCSHYAPDHLPNNACAFENRCGKIYDQIRWANADVTFLCEVNPVSWYRKTFAQTHDILFVSKHNSDELQNPDVNNSNMTVEIMRENVNDQDDGCCFMFKRGAVELISCTHVLFQDPDQITVINNNNNNNNNTDNNISSSRAALLLLPGKYRARQNALVAHLRCVNSKKTFFIVGTHLKANGQQDEDAKRICHLKQLFQRLANIRAVDIGAPLFICGDLNAPPNSPTMKLLFDGSTTLSDGGNKSLHQLPHTGYVSTMRELSDDGATECPFTILDSSYGNGPWSSVLDYVLYEKTARDSKRVIPIACLVPPKLESAGTDAILFCGSDHIPICCEYFI